MFLPQLRLVLNVQLESFTKEFHSLLLILPIIWTTNNTKQITNIQWTNEFLYNQDN